MSSRENTKKSPIRKNKLLQKFRVTRYICRALWVTPCCCPSEGYQRSCWKPIETSVNEFCYESINSSLEELINIEVIFFSKTRTIQNGKSRKVSHFFLTYTTVLSPSKCRITQKLRNSSEHDHKTKKLSI